MAFMTRIAELHHHHMSLSKTCLKASCLELTMSPAEGRGLLAADAKGVKEAVIPVHTPETQDAALWESRQLSCVSTP